MPISDERIMELAKLNCSIHGYVFPVPFARAIEAEAMKPQEPVSGAVYLVWNVKTLSWKEVQKTVFSSVDDEDRWMLFTTPQPCPDCLHNITMAQEHYDIMRKMTNKAVELARLIDSHGPEGHSFTNGQYIAMRIKKQELEAERDALAMQNQQGREALELAAKTISDLETSGDLDTETTPTLMEALALPDNTEIIKRHDAAVLAEVVERIIDAASVGGETGIEVVRTMIKEIGAQL